MSYRDSEQRIFEAETAMREGDVERARALFRQAAELQAEFVDAQPAERVKTKSVFGVSAAVLFYQGGDLDAAAPRAQHPARREDAHVADAVDDHVVGRAVLHEILGVPRVAGQPIGGAVEGVGVHQGLALELRALLSGGQHSGVCTGPHVGIVPDLSRSRTAPGRSARCPKLLATPDTPGTAR